MLESLFRHPMVAPFVPHVFGVLRYRGKAVLFACLLAPVLWAMILMLPPEFRAVSKVSVDTERLVRPLLQGLTVNDDVMSEVQMMAWLLKSRPQLEKLARQADLDIQVTTDAEFNALLEGLSSKITIGRDPVQGVFTIGFEDANRDKALRINKILLNNFVEDTVGSGQEDEKHAEDTLRGEIEDYERRLTEAEIRLKEFRQENVGLMPDDRGDYYQQLTNAMDALSASQSELRLANRRARTLQLQLDGEQPVFGFGNSSSGARNVSSRHDARIQELESRLNSLLVEYTERHPEVVRTQTSLDELRVLREKDIESAPLPTDPTTGNINLNPIYQNLRIQLNSVEVEISNLQGVVAERKATVDNLKRLVDVVPEVEAQLNRLNRDYDVVNNRYQAMLERWESLQTSKRVASDSSSVQFRIVEPPFVPLTPEGPPRGPLLFVVTILAAMVGVGIAVVLHLINPAYHTTQHLASHLQMPLVGTIARLQNEAQLLSRRRQVTWIAVGCVFLFVGCVALAMVADTGARALQGLLA